MAALQSVPVSVSYDLGMYMGVKGRDRERWKKKKSWHVKREKKRCVCMCEMGRVVLCACVCFEEIGEMGEIWKQEQRKTKKPVARNWWRQWRRV